MSFCNLWKHIDTYLRTKLEEKGLKERKKINTTRVYKLYSFFSAACNLFYNKDVV